MISNLWIDSRKHNWNRLDALVREVETAGVKSLSPADLRDLGLLYRQSAADLSAVRADSSSRTLEQYLNRLVARAHNFVYSGRRITVGTLWRFFAYGYPRLLRRLKLYVFAATGATILTAVLGALITLVRPNFAVMFLGPEMMDKINHQQMWTERVLNAQAPWSSFIMANNIWVCFMTFIGGITGGLSTLFYLFKNGLMLGVITTACAQHHMSIKLWSFIASHGALELPSIVIAGAAGLRLGAGILFPGMLRRRDALSLAGLESIQLVSAVIPLLIVAGTLEAFVSPTHIPVGIKFSIGAVLFTGLVLWLSEGGREVVEFTK